ncbi:MAG TPA: tlde1 domain-containing protein [Pararhizobium sp.]|nr:tlde1 domain-containing protein [Pararhizobium sp.]
MTAPAEIPMPSIRPLMPAEAMPTPEPPKERQLADAAPETAAPTPASQTAAEAITASLPLPAPRPDHQAPSTLLAYARPDESADTIRQSVRHVALPGPGSGIAVYSIKAATVYLPGGQKLEAHSGLGRMHDKPKFADEKNRGPTPPNVYSLVMREHLFHGVQAIRLLPSDGVNKYGRNGFLAHTYMLHGTNQSNGCVVFKHYAKFLKAFKKGKIDRLIVVPELSALPKLMASL